MTALPLKKKYIKSTTAVTCHLMTRICSEKCVLGDFVTVGTAAECAHTNLDGAAHGTPGLPGMARCSPAPSPSTHTLLCWIL